MKEEFSLYVGVDWGVEFHQACILDVHGEKICQRRIEHSGSGMLEFCDFLQALTNGEPCWNITTRYSRSIQSKSALPRRPHGCLSGLFPCHCRQTSDRLSA